MARTYQEMTKDELLREQESLLARYKDFQAKGLQLDMSRGKPCKEQLDLSVGMNDVKDYVSGGVDVRNYGILDGIASCKQLFAELLEVPAENVIIGPNESLTLMFDFICQCYTHGIGGKPWSQEKEVKILCPVPGYDRHFTVCQYFGLQMVNVPMNADGPDMDTIEELVKDPSVKGMFCVPKYSNPTGITFSDAVVRRIAALHPLLAYKYTIKQNPCQAGKQKIVCIYRLFYTFVLIIQYASVFVNNRRRTIHCVLHSAAHLAQLRITHTFHHCIQQQRYAQHSGQRQGGMKRIDHTHDP